MGSERQSPRETNALMPLLLRALVTVLLQLALYGCVADSESSVQTANRDHVPHLVEDQISAGAAGPSAMISYEDEKPFLGAITGLAPGGAGSFTASASFTHAGTRRFALDVHNIKSGQTIVSEEITDVDGQEVIRQLHFKHEGGPQDLEIVLRETPGGAVVDRWNPQ